MNLGCEQTCDSWRLGHVVPDDVVIADIGDQALDILLHGPASTHKNGIVKTFTHTSIPSTHNCNFYHFFGLSTSFCFCFLSWVSISFFFPRLFYLFARLGVVFLWGGLGFFFSSSSSSSFCFLNLGCKQTYDSWRPGHVEPDDVIADIGDQALDIFLHGHVPSLWRWPGSLTDAHQHCSNVGGLLA